VGIVDKKNNSNNNNNNKRRPRGQKKGRGREGKGERESRGNTPRRTQNAHKEKTDYVKRRRPATICFDITWTNACSFPMQQEKQNHNN